MWEKYKLVEKIAEGGMGEIWLAYSKENAGLYAAKKIKPDLIRTKDLVRFNREAINMSKFKHANIARIVDVSDASEVPGYVMEYCKNGNIESLLQRTKRDNLLASKIIFQVCKAINELHTSELRIIHRDIKPANVLIGEDGNYKLADFGLSVSLSDDATRVTTSNWISYGFSPPEQNMDMSSVDERADIFSIGALAYYLITGNYYKNTNDFTSNNFGWALKQMLPHMLAIDPNDRVNTIDEILKAFYCLSNFDYFWDTLTPKYGRYDYCYCSVLTNCPECGRWAIKEMDNASTPEGIICLTCTFEVEFKGDAGGRKVSDILKEYDAGDAGPWDNNGQFAGL